MNQKDILTSQSYLRQERLIALSVLGILLFNYPILSLFNDLLFLFGIPLLYLYFFIIWLFFLGLLAWIVRAKSSSL